MREKGVKSLFEDIIAENFPVLGKEIDVQVLKGQRALNKKNQRRRGEKMVA